MNIKKEKEKEINKSFQAFGPCYTFKAYIKSSHKVLILTIYLSKKNFCNSIPGIRLFNLMTLIKPLTLYLFIFYYLFIFMD